MKILENLKYRYASYKLKAISANTIRPGLACNLRKAKRLGILYETNSQADVVIIKELVSELKVFVPEVISLGYYDSKQLESWHLQPIDFHFFCNADLNWYYKPIEGFTKEFANIEFDILINLTNGKKIACDFITLSSQSTFKVGRLIEGLPDYFDLSIKVNEDSDLEEENLKKIIKQIKHYLLLINPS